MKILLTGKPRSGKTTLLHTLIEEIPSRRGLVAIEVREAGERIGFDLLDNSARTAVLARTDKPTRYPVSRYFVDLASFNDFIEPLFEYKPGQLLYIDEIGHMQLFSEKFQRLALEYLDTDNDFIGTISYVYEHLFIDEVRSRKDILLCTVTPENRDELKATLQAVLAHREQFGRLSGKRQQTVRILVNTFAPQPAVRPVVSVLLQSAFAAQCPDGVGHGCSSAAIRPVLLG